jgi:TPR repeat protein
MTEEPTQTLWRMRWNNLGLVGLVAALMFASLLAGQYLERSRAMTPETKLQIALQAFRSGYDETALSILTPLADEGNSKAQYWLADIYENGLGVKPEATEVVSLFEKSAAQGFVPAQRRLGELYLRGNETLQDFGKAQTWLRRAATAGDAEAQRMLGQMFALGLGVTPDRPQAYGWYENAALGGDGLAKHLRDRLLTSMSPAEMAKGEQIAKDIAAEINPPPSHKL